MKENSFKEYSVLAMMSKKEQPPIKATIRCEMSNEEQPPMKLTTDSVRTDSGTEASVEPTIMFFSREYSLNTRQM